jgi:hypothetical protein
MYIYIIIWLRPYVLFVQSLSPPKPAGLDPQILAGLPQISGVTPIDKKIEKKIHEKILKIFFW